MMSFNPKILIISHNVFSTTSNMGKTLSTYFTEWDKANLAQLYFHSEIPNNDVCTTYYRITDTDILKSYFRKDGCGETFERQNIDFGRKSTRVDTGKLSKVYQYGRKRTPIIYVLRNAIWKFSPWDSKKLERWLDDFSPDMVFFASGDYSFSYNIALHISEKRNIPLIVSCMDDYYLHSRNEKSWLGRWQHKHFMKVVRKTMDRASCIMTINDKMAREYARLFSKVCYTLYTGVLQKTVSVPDDEKKGISYLGNMGYKRNQQLVSIGQALKRISSPEDELFLDVYSGETNPELLKDLTTENGIRFHGAVAAGKVGEIIAKSLAIVHTESFDEENKQRVMYSTSTKIAESLASGTCLFAYGPAEVASMEYLIENNAAVTVTSPDALEEGLKRVFSDAELRKKVVANALCLAEKNHRLDLVSKTVKNAVNYACGKE